MPITYTIQGFDLHQPDLGFRLLESTAYAPAVAPRRVDLYVPRLHGEIPLWNDELDTQKLFLRMRIQDTDPAELQTKWEYLRRLMWTGSNQGLTVRRVVGEQVTSTFAQLESMTQPDYHCPRGLLSTDIVLNIPSGRWSDINAETFNVFTTASNQDLAPVSESSAPVWMPLVRLEGPITNWFTLADRTSQTGFRFFFIEDLPASTYLYIDVDRHTWWTSSSDDDWDTPTGTTLNGRMSTLWNGPLSMVSVPSFEIGQSTSAIWAQTSGGDVDIPQIFLRLRRTYL